MVPKIMKPFLAGVLAKTKNDEHFVKGILGTLKSILFEPSWVHLVLGFEQPHFKFKRILDTMHMIMQSQAKAKAIGLWHRSG